MKRVFVMMLVLCFASVAQAELLTANRGFEAGDTSDWMQWGSGDDGAGWQSWNDTWGVVSDGTAYEGDYYLNQTQQGSVWGYTLAWQGQATTIAVGPNTPLLLSGYVRTENADAFLKLESYDSGDTNLGADLEVNFGSSIVKDGSTWNYIEMSYVTPANTDHIRAAVGANNGVFSVDADAMSLVVIPEPASMVLLGLGLGVLFLRRRE